MDVAVRRPRLREMPMQKQTEETQNNKFDKER